MIKIIVDGVCRSCWGRPGECSFEIMSNCGTILTKSMTLHINKYLSIGELQQPFNEWYPYLKIELLTRRPALKNGHPVDGLTASQLPLRSVAGNLPEGEIELRDDMSVHELEQLFQDRFGLHIQVFRKSGNLWLETTVTDSWTLKQQNDHGRELEQVRLAGGRGR